MGICTESESLVAPTDPSEYMWMYFGDNVTVQNIRMIYLATTEENIEDVVQPGNPEFVIFAKQGFVAVSKGVIGVETNVDFWDYPLPPYDANKYLYEAMEMEMSDGSKVYTEVKRSSAWDAYYKLDIGGANLIRNSKTLLDDRIYWFEENYIIEE